MLQSRRCSRGDPLPFSCGALGTHAAAVHVNVGLFPSGVGEWSGLRARGLGRPKVGCTGK